MSTQISSQYRVNTNSQMAESGGLIKALSVKEFAVDPSDPDATKQYDFWIKKADTLFNKTQSR